MFAEYHCTTVKTFFLCPSIYSMRKFLQSPYYFLTLVVVLFVFNYADRMVMASLLPLIKADWQVTDTDLGFVTGSVSLFVALFVLPASLLVDRWSRKYMIVIMAIVWSMATFLCAFASNFHQLVIFRALTGIGEAAFSPAAVALISKLFPRSSRASHIGIFNAGAPIGAGLGFVAGGYIGMVWGWRHAFGLVALPGLLVALAFLLVKDYRTQPLSADNQLDKEEGIVQSVLNLGKIPTIWAVYVAYAFAIAVNSSMMVWIPSYFVRYHSLNEKDAGLFAGAIAMLILVGAPIGGKLADVWRKKNILGKQYLCTISVLIASVLLVAAILTSNLTVALTLFGLFGVMAVMFIAPATSIIQDVVQPGLRAMGYGINVFFENFLGAFLAPLLVGFISDLTSLKQALLVLPLFGVFSAVLFYWSAQFYSKDMHRASHC